MAKGKPISALPNLTRLKEGDIGYFAEQLPGPVFGPGSSKNVKVEDGVIPRAYSISSSQTFDLDTFGGDVVIVCTNTAEITVTLSGSLPTGRRCVIVNRGESTVRVDGNTDFSPRLLSASQHVYTSTDSVMRGYANLEQGYDERERALYSDRRLELLVNAQRLSSGQYEAPFSSSSAPLQLLIDLSAGQESDGAFVINTTTDDPSSGAFTFNKTLFTTDLYQSSSSVPFGFGVPVTSDWRQLNDANLQNRHGAYSAFLHALTGGLYDAFLHGGYTENPASNEFVFVDGGDATTEVRRELLIDNQRGGKMYAIAEGASPGDPSFVLIYERDGDGYKTPPAKVNLPISGEIAYGAAISPATGRIFVLGASTGTLGTEDCALIWSDDEGATWSAETGLPNGCNSLNVLQDGRVLIGQDQSSSPFCRMQYSVDNGATFSAGTDIPTTDINNFFANFGKLAEQSSGALVMPGKTKLWRSTDKGVTWAQVYTVGASTSGFIRARRLEVNGTETVFACNSISSAFNGGLYKSTDGLSWSLVPGANLDRAEDILQAQNGDIYLARELVSPYDATISKSTDGGNTFTEFSKLSDNPAYANNRLGGLQQLEATGSIFGSFGDNATQNPVLLALDTEIDIATNDGTPIKMRFQNGRFSLLHSKDTVAASDVINFGPETIGITKDQIAFLRGDSPQIAPADADIGSFFRNSADSGELYLKWLDGSSNKVGGAGGSSPTGFVVGETGSHVEATSGSFNLSAGDGYAFEFVGKVTGPAAKCSLQIGPNATGQENYLNVSLFDDAGAVLSALQVTVPLGTVGRFEFSLPVPPASITAGSGYYIYMHHGGGPSGGGPMEIARSWTTTTNYSYFSSVDFPPSLPTANPTNRVWYAALFN